MLDSQHRQRLPYKSAAVALLFSVFFGPVGLLYASVIGGVVMIALGFIVLSSKFFVAMAIVWVSSCVWAVAAVNRYNQQLMKVLINHA